MVARTVAVVFSLVAFDLAGCGKKTGADETPASPEAETYTKGLEDLADRMCACKDGTCLSTINTDFTKLARSGAGSPAQTKRANEASKRYSDCVTTALEAAKANPGAEGPARFVTAIEDFSERVCACSDLRCVESIRDSLDSYTRQWSKLIEGGTPSSDLAQRLAAANTRFNDCQAKLLGAAQAALATAPDAAPDIPSTLSPSCEKFKKTVEAFAGCDKMTPEIRDNLFKAYDALDKTDDLCLQGIEALKEPAGRMGCPLPP